MPEFLESVVTVTRNGIKRLNGTTESGVSIGFLSRPIGDSFFIESMKDCTIPVSCDNPWIDRYVRRRLTEQYSSKDFYVHVRNIQVIPGIVQIDDEHQEKFSSLYVSYAVYVKKY